MVLPVGSGKGLLLGLRLLSVFSHHRRGKELLSGLLYEDIYLVPEGGALMTWPAKFMSFLHAKFIPKVLKTLICSSIDSKF